MPALLWIGMTHLQNYSYEFFRNFPRYVLLKKGRDHEVMQLDPDWQNQLISSGELRMPQLPRQLMRQNVGKRVTNEARKH
ncbi:hypothetical protein ABB26_03630 [Stenotrophomonas humi]|uniref:Uncharacterized protein n=1 Tax=Stenotrophomonas humi TaxID=405444 RepID=A0A0R0C8V5_9GAMM|nr:hypothetical protein ABB26_03630 [Stenotrophomonas humi]